MLTDVGHLDRSIKLFVPDYKLASIRPKIPRQIAEALVKRKGLEFTPAMIEQMRKNVWAVVRRLAGNGMIREAGLAGAVTTWMVC